MTIRERDARYIGETVISIQGHVGLVWHSREDSLTIDANTANTRTLPPTAQTRSGRPGWQGGVSSSQIEIVEVFDIVDVRPYETGCVKRAGILVTQVGVIKAFVGGDRNRWVKRAGILVTQVGVIKAFVGGDRNRWVKRAGILVTQVGVIKAFVGGDRNRWVKRAGILVYRRLSCNSEVKINEIDMFKAPTKASGSHKASGSVLLEGMAFSLMVDGVRKALHSHRTRDRSLLNLIARKAGHVQRTSLNLITRKLIHKCIK
ncbi:hypothetical protein BDZ89DRAFT_1050459 [Hymenopellis radicata]|nr:hypothetical protein BDZ89DRAFT_1050459 [Hymenopellis radicata]